MHRRLRTNTAKWLSIAVFGCTLIGCKVWNNVQLLGQETRDTDNINAATQPDSAAAKGLKLAKPYRIHNVCYTSITGEGLDDIAKSCSAGERYIANQCGPDVKVETLIDPPISLLDQRAVESAQQGIAGFWLINAHGVFDQKTLQTKILVNPKCNQQEFELSTNIVQTIRSKDSAAIWIAACHAEIIGTKFKNVGFSSRASQVSSVAKYADIGGPGSDLSVIYLIDRICSATSLDKDGDGMLNGAELGGEELTWNPMVLPRKDFEEKKAANYQIENPMFGFIASAMYCTDATGVEYLLGYRGYDVDIFVDTRENAENLFSSVKPIENSNPTRYPFGDRVYGIPAPRVPLSAKDDDQKVAKLRYADDFPRTFKIGADPSELTVLKNCRPRIEEAVKFVGRANNDRTVEIQVNTQRAIVSDIQIPLPTWQVVTP
jgi:hypothetical protein